MKEIRITENVSISELTMGALNTENKDSPEIMDRYLEAGGFTFDTARSYQDGEYDAFLGNWIRERGVRDRITVCMKGCFPNRATMHISRLSKAEIKGDLETSLKVSGLEYTDLFVLHRDDTKLPVEDIVLACNELLREGKAKAIGVSNWTGGRIGMANDFARKNGLVPFSVCQMHFSLAETTAALTQDLTHVPMNDVEYRWHLENGTPIMGFCSQGRGFFARVEAGREFSGYSLQYYSYLPENHRRAARAIELGKQYGVSATAIAIAYLRANPLRTSALVSFSSIRQYEDSMATFQVNLTPGEVRYLETGER